MKHISILVLNNARLTSIELPHEGFQEVNSILKNNGNKPLFDIHLVGATKEVLLSNGKYIVNTDLLLDQVNKTDLIIIPAMIGDLKETLNLNKEFIPWIISQYKKGAEVASLCVGAFLLASTGLLNDRQCSTHWRAANDFRKLFPFVELALDKVITDEDGIYSSGGALSSSNLILYLIEKFAGRDISIQCSKMFEIDIDRKYQSPFMIFNGQKDHEDEVVKKTQEFIENNFHNKFTVDQLATMFALSRRNLERRFKRVTSNTIVEYIQRVKIEAAKKNLEAGRKSINEVMYEVGYNDTKAFRSTFKRITGISPLQYKNKYSREIII